MFFIHVLINNFYFLIKILDFFHIVHKWYPLLNSILLNRNIFGNSVYVLWYFRWKCLSAFVIEQRFLFIFIKIYAFLFDNKLRQIEIAYGNISFNGWRICLKACLSCEIVFWDLLFLRSDAVRNFMKFYHFTDFYFYDN